MKKSLPVLMMVLSLIMNGTAHARAAKPSLKVRQTRKVSPVTREGSVREVQNYLRSAELLAESLDEKSGRIIHSLEMSPLKRWLNRSKEDQLKRIYAEELMLHMSRMTSLFRAHRQAGSFAKLNEFEFQSLLVKSDYLLSLAISRQSLEFSRDSEIFKTRFNAIMQEYNSERLGFDQKMIRFAFALNR